MIYFIFNYKRNRKDKSIVESYRLITAQKHHTREKNISENQRNDMRYNNESCTTRKENAISIENTGSSFTITQSIHNERRVH